MMVEIAPNLTSHLGKTIVKVGENEMERIFQIAIHDDKVLYCTLCFLSPMKFTMGVQWLS